VVFARRRRRRESVVKRAAYFLFYRVLRRLSEIPIPLDTGDFALMDRQAVQELNGLPERTRFIRGLRSWVGFRQAEVEYDRDIRRGGRSKYTFSRLVRLAMDGIFGFSKVPLKAITATGVLVVLLSAGGLAAGATGGWALLPEHVGLVWLGAALGLLGGIQLIALGVAGEYVARIYHEVRGRPMYVACERIGFSPLPRAVPHVIDFLPPGPAERQERLTAARLTPDWADRPTVRETGV
jgi:hypothetical protein